ncbi:DUF5671 domain-containing protein [Microbacterium sp. 2FI]|uniref:DUF5671 domain-containing protein n=1 Tax=Microbacterium sp. 2FI TaxID=2502193 RepID=UPI0010F7535C|nr:DUF5671 domain-containing protein [Microbacterium sp. 2FI]
MSGAGPTSTARAGTVVRRLILLGILFALVAIGATGVSGLLERVLGAGRSLAGGDTGLALSLAFALIGVPLAGLLWWWQRRLLARDDERASLLWALYVALMYLTALITATAALASTASDAVDGEFRPGPLATAVVWAFVWVWHRWMWRSPRTAPTRLHLLPIDLAAVYGLAVGAAAMITALAALIAEALTTVTMSMIGSRHWAIAVLQALIWLAIGALVWWWHWVRDRAKDDASMFGNVLLAILLGAAAATTVIGVGTVLHIVLRVLFTGEPPVQALASLDTAIASALVGGLVWVHLGGVLAGRAPAARRAGRLVVSAIGLVFAASGFGVIVNALLASLTAVLVDDDPRILLYGGVSALVVGGPVWWLAWRPQRPIDADEAASPARRVYLVAVFGASAIVGLVTVLLIGYRVFEFLLAPADRGLVEHIRVPLGLLSAAALVFGYHFAIWRRDRALAPAAARTQLIGRIVLVAPGDPAELAAALRGATGAPVTVWRTAEPGAVPELSVFLEALGDVSAPRVLVIASEEHVEAIALAE